MVIPGSWKTAPARNTGVPLIRNNQLATSAEASLDAFSRKSTAASGKGTMKTRKKSGNMAEYAHLLPRKRKAPAIAKQTNDSAISVRRRALRSCTAAPTSSRRVMSRAAAVPACSATSKALRSSGSRRS